MTAQSLPDKANKQVAFFTTENFGPAPHKGYWYAKPDGTKAYRLEHVAIFRSGEFMDSMGYEHAWDPFHIQTMVNNFNLLRQGSTFVDPPVRAGHPEIFSNNMRNLIGYVESLSAETSVSPADGTEYTYLFADYEILDEEAASKIESKLWRHRSAEIGGYITNSKTEFWPVLAGFAYVDIPAVEGLNFSKFTGAGKDYTIVVEDNKEEGLVAKENDQDSGQGTSTHTASAQNGPATPPIPAVPAVPAAPQQVLAPHSFTIAGQQVSDFAAVQRHITELEDFQRETQESGRKAFVTGLASSNKIFATQVAPMTELVLGMTGEQFGKFTASYADVPEMPVLSVHEVAPDAGGTPDGPGGAEDPEVEKARRIYTRHVQSGMAAAQLAETPSAKLLASKGIKL